LVIIARSTQRDRGQRKEKVEECPWQHLGGMQNFVGAMENLHPQTFGRGATDLVMEQYLPIIVDLEALIWV
jgi:hypothetical protein